MLRTRTLSCVGAFLMIVLALVDGWQVIKGVQLAENLSPEAVIEATIPPVAIASGFGFRFIALVGLRRITILGFLSWWVAFCAVALPVARSMHFAQHGFPKVHPYTMTPLEWAGILFVVISMVRFSVTLSVAISSQDDIDSYS